MTGLYFVLLTNQATEADMDTKQTLPSNDKDIAIVNIAEFRNLRGEKLTLTLDRSDKYDTILFPKTPPSAPTNIPHTTCANDSAPWHVRNPSFQNTLKEVKKCH
jgi:hypothetical protein